MEFVVVDTTAFKHAALSVTRIISTKSAQPALAFLKISATTEGIIIEAVNPVLTMKRFLPCIEDKGQIIQVIKPGSILIPPTYFVEILKKLPKKIQMKVNENFQLTIESENIKTTFSGMDPTVYPNQPILEQVNTIYTHIDMLRKMIDHTLFAVSNNNETNPALTGVNWVFDKKTWYAIATNSQRLVLTKHSHIGNGIEGSYILPAKVLAECLHCFKNIDNEITIVFSDRYVLFQGEHIQLYSKLISSSFPDVKKLIPKESNTEIIVETSNFLKGIERMSLLAATKKNHNVTLAIGDNNTITLHAEAGEVGGITEKQPVKQLVGDTDFQILFDGKYMKESLGVIKDESVKLTFAGPFRPIRIEPVEGEAFLHLISPLRG